jgi:hypothetical protein
MTNQETKPVALQKEMKLAIEMQKKPVTRHFCNDCTEDHGDILLIHGLWARGTVCIINVHITDVT